MTTPGHADADRWTRGVAIMETIQGRDEAQAIRDGFEAMFPASGRYVVEAGFADVYDRPGLDLRTRRLTTFASLTTLGGCEPQLAAHVRGALNVGVTAEELLEATFQLALYAGHARAGNAMRVVLEVCRERGIEPKPAEGSATRPTTTSRGEEA